MTTAIGVVVIGRNEGERLRTCLESVDSGLTCVYVDSGSTDDSVALAASLGAQVVELEERRGFTAARARNAGFQRVHELRPDAAFVQFVDGDCELFPRWLAAATVFLDSHSDVAVVCGRLRERHPEASVYNKLCDMEWDAPAGEIDACGGNAMARVAAFDDAGGFREGLIAGEEPEFCVRLRRLGWKVWRMTDEMAWHDAAMATFGQWWRRSVRNGHAFAEGANLHGAGPERHWVRESRSALIWGIALPLAGVLLLTQSWIAGLLVFLCYPAQMARLTLRGGRAPKDNALQAFFWMLGKFPEAIGNLKYRYSRILGRRPNLIEYK